MHHKDIPEAKLGRVFYILGVKNEELGEATKAWKARCVFQCSNLRTKAGTSAADLFEETSNAPASFAAARAALGVAALKGFNASLRDAETAYLQAIIDTELRLSLRYHESGGPILGSKTARNVRSRNTIVRIAGC